jgi:hypothetical protein
MPTIDPNTVSLFRDSAHIPEHYWQELSAMDSEEVCLRALVSHEARQGYAIPFLHRHYLCQPEVRRILGQDNPEKPLRFQEYLVLLIYLIKAQDLPLEGKRISEREIPGGDLFFRGPHALFKEPLEKKFGKDPRGFLDCGQRLGGRETGKGDASFELRALPRILVEYILYGEDEEFPAQITINFDATIYRHLPLDVIWAMINVTGQRLLAEEKD